MKHPKILFVSTLMSPSSIEDIFMRGGENPGFSIQKFNRLVAEGLVKNDVSVSTLSSPPVVPGSLRRFEKFPDEEVNGVNYSSVPLVDVPIIRNITSFLFSFFRTISFVRKNRKKRKNSKHINDPVIICDVLKFGISGGALLASKLTGTKSIGILTDLPHLMITQKGIKDKLIAVAKTFLMKRFSGYIFLTESMNKVVNIHRKPYIVMEGIVDEVSDSGVSSQNEAYLESVKKEKNIVYAGGLYHEYGLRNLIEAVHSLPDPELRLDLFGKGNIVKEIKDLSLKDPRIRYHGVWDNNSVVEFEKESWLLVNPRPTVEEFAKYSFPSKNLEYMSTGAPVLTTVLPGMPKEYYPHVYFIKEETPEGIAREITRLLELPAADLMEKGKRACDFIHKEKNNRRRGKEILELTKLV